MKKRTKKKLAKIAKKTGKGLVKVGLVYPAKGIWYASKAGYNALRKKKDIKSNVIDVPVNVKKPTKGSIKSDAAFDSLQEIRNLEGEVESFESKLLENKSYIGIILGARGTGKSAIGMRILENFKSKTDKKVYALGFNPSSLPSWITVIHDISHIQNDAVILIDEGGIEFSSRKSMSGANTLLSELLLIARHKDLTVLFITQNSSNLEINAIRQADFLVLKPSSLLQKDFERRKIKDVYEKVDSHFKELKGEVGLTYIYADGYRGFVSNSLPSFWSEKVSKGYSEK